ncbi:metal-dependent hydrolase family protein [Euzebya tangerina]|uniref:metal-dependent hydrolase family protein n=1 Tax=Euzebya tangerina TaxID=591198 RepID=UPI000E31F892|nr:amidohydrolase family protein [Euzebya tangerina]
MSGHMLISGGTVIDATGAAARPDTSVLLRGDEIVALGSEADQLAARTSGDLTTIDATGQTVMPGLIDAHTHLTFGEPTGNDELFNHRTQGYSAMLSAYNAQKVLRAGVTGVLDADCLWMIGVELREAIESGIVEGPRMRAGGNALMTSIGGTAGRMIADEGRTGYAVVVRTIDEIVTEVRQQIKHGVDWIKVHVTGLLPNRKGGEIKVWSLEELKAVCDTAHDVGIPVVGHCRNASSTREAAEAGMDLIYHASYIDEAALEAVVDNGSALCPTFTLLGNLADYGHRIGSAPELIEVFRAEIETTAKMIRRAHDAGVTVLTGSETGFAVTPIGEWHARELEMLVTYMGFSEMDAILCATRNGAMALQMDGEIGQLQPGFRADLLVVDGDPLQDVSILQDRTRLSHVISRGVRVDTERPIPERTIRPSEQVRFLAACPLTQQLALTEDDLETLSHV